MKFLAIIFMLLLPVIASAAGSCTVSSYYLYNNIVEQYPKVIVYQFKWTSDAAGDVSGVSTCATLMSGNLRAVNFKSGHVNNPAAGDIPTTGYSVSLLTANSENLLSDGTTSVGTNIPSAVTSPLQRKIPIESSERTKYIFNEIVNISVSGAGDTNKGTTEVIVW